MKICTVAEIHTSGLPSLLGRDMTVPYPAGYCVMNRDLFARGGSPSRVYTSCPIFYCLHCFIPSSQQQGPHVQMARTISLAGSHDTVARQYYRVTDGHTSPSCNMWSGLQSHPWTSPYAHEPTSRQAQEDRRRKTSPTRRIAETHTR